MKHEKKPEDFAAEQWLNELLNTQAREDEIGADHQAMDAAGLRPPTDLDLSEMSSVQNTPGQAEPFHDDAFRDAFGEGAGLTQIIDEINRQPLPEAVSPTESTQHFDSPEWVAMSQTMPIEASPPTQILPEVQMPYNDEGSTPGAGVSPIAVPPGEKPAPPVNRRRQPESRKLKDKVRAKQEPEATKEEAQKGRPKRKNSYGIFLGIPHLLSTVVWLGMILLIGVTAGRMIWLCATDVLAFDREPITATVVVEETDTVEDVAQKLQKAGLIRYTGLFELYADLSDAQEKIRPGTYEFNPVSKDTELIVYDYMALVSVMSPASGPTVVEDLRIPEGYTCAQIFQLLEENNVCTVEELEEYATNGELNDYWFLEDVQRGDKYCLEGYLFPDTYDFYENDDPERVLEKMLNAFDQSITDQMRDDLNMLNTKLEEMMSANGYDSTYIEQHRITIREVVIIASMIEKETANNVESFTIASVIYNRLTNAGEFPYLNIDATLVYALNGKADLTEQDKKLDSPYNTYNHRGLPPGPISSPSQNSLAAALQPEDTDYYYYAYNPSKEEHQFNNSYEDHLLFLESLKNAQTQEANNE